jgi:hypothetical protein
VRRALTATAAALLLGAAVAGCGGGSDSAAPASHPATSAARRLDQAAAAMQQVASYRFDATVGVGTSQVKLTGEFQAPDRVHESITLTGQAPVEVVFAGNQAFVKDATTGAWRNRVQATAATTTDVRAAFGALTKADSVSRQGSTYAFRVPGDAALALVGTNATTSIPAVAALNGNEISTLTYQPTVDGQKLRVSITYTDVNRAPPVSVPTAT